MYECDHVFPMHLDNFIGITYLFDEYVIYYFVCHVTHC